MFCLWTRIRVKVGDRGKYSISVSSAKIIKKFIKCSYELVVQFLSAVSVSSVIPTLTVKVCGVDYGLIFDKNGMRLQQSSIGKNKLFFLMLYKLYGIIG